MRLTASVSKMEDSSDSSDAESARSLDITDISNRESDSDVENSDVASTDDGGDLNQDCPGHNLLSFLSLKLLKGLHLVTRDSNSLRGVHGNMES